MKIGVLGAGAFGTALAKVCAERGHDVVLWARGDDAAREIQETRENKKYLPGAKVPLSLVATSDLERAVADKPIILSVAPSHATRALWQDARKYLGEDTIVVGASKGIENESLATMDEVLHQ